MPTPAAVRRAEDFRSTSAPPSGTAEFPRLFASGENCTHGLANAVGSVYSSGKIGIFGLLGGGFPAVS
jgi:hypothetical protein